MEIVKIVPAPDSRAALLRIRENVLAEYRSHFPDRFDATLTESDDGTWIDVWRWADRADAERALAHRELIPSFADWERLVTLRKIAWSEIIG